MWQIYVKLRRYFMCINISFYFILSGFCRYRAAYSYVPQNDDELPLEDGEEVIVLEKCDDGWFVGHSVKTGLFGTFPGNYVVALCKYMRSNSNRVNCTCFGEFVVLR